VRSRLKLLGSLARLSLDHSTRRLLRDGSTAVRFGTNHEPATGMASVAKATKSFFSTDVTVGLIAYGALSLLVGLEALDSSFSGKNHN
jgi:hypothetical protein